MLASIDKDGNFTSIFKKQLVEIDDKIRDIFPNIERFVNTKPSTKEWDDWVNELEGADDSLKDFLKTKDEAYQTKDLATYNKYLQDQNKLIDIQTVKTKALNVVKKIGLNLAIAVASAIVTKLAESAIKFIDNYIHRVEKAREKTEQLASQFSEIKSSLDDIGSKLETTKKRIDELNGKGSLSLVEQSELERLQAENKELERKNTLLTEQANIKKKEVADSVKREYQLAYREKTYNSLYVTEGQKAIAENPTHNASQVYADAGKITGEEWLEQAKKKYKELYSEYLNDPTLFVDKNGNDNAKKKQMDSLRQELINRSLEIDDYIERYGFEDEWSKKQHEISLGISFVLYPNQYQSEIVDNLFTKLDDTTQKEIEHKVQNGDFGLSDLPTEFVNSLVAYGIDPNDIVKEVKSRFQPIADEIVDVVKHTRSDMIEKINGTSDAFNILDEIYTDIIDGGTFDFTKLNKSKFKEAFAGLESEYEDFIETVSMNPTDIDATQKAFNNLVTAYLNNKNILGDLTEENKDLTIAMLKNMGVANAESVVERELNAQKELAKYNAENLTKMTYGEAASFIEETSASEDVKQALAQLALEKSNLNGIKIDTANEVEALIKLAKQAGVTKEILDKLTIAQATFNASEIINKGIDLPGAAGAEYRKQAELIKEQVVEVQKFLDENKWEFEYDREQFKNKVSIEYEGGDKSSSLKEKNNQLDWIETLLSRIQRTITNLGKTVSATYKGWSKRNNALAQEMKEINKEISTQSTAYEAYMAKANSVQLSEEYKALVRNGGFSFSEIEDDALKKNIDLYRQWYEKALNCSDAIEDLRSNLADLAKTKFDNVSKQYDEQMLMIDHNIDMLQGFVEQSETAGYMASEVYYQAMAEKQQENIAELQDKYGSLLSAFDEAVKNGSIEKYSEEWYNMLGDINDVEKELQSANTQLIEFNQTLQQLSWDVFDRVRDSISDINSEANFLIDIISRSDLFTDDGQITNEGLAVQGLHAVNYNTYMEQSLAYAEEIKRLNDEIAKDPYDLELIDRKNELIKAQQEAIANANSEKDAIQSLISDGYDKMLESLNELISKSKELLNSRKDLYDYENNITKQTKNIASLRKQLEAYKYDNSENAKATIQKLQVSLSEAEAGLKETEYEKYLNDQEQLLDKLYSDTEEWVTQRLDDIDGLIIKAVDATNQNAETISNTINSASNAYGIKLSDKMDAIWNSRENSINGINTVVSIYGDIAHDDITSVGSNITSAITGGNTNVISAINNVQVSMNQMISELNAIATNNKNTIANAQNTVVNNQNPISSNSNTQTNTSKPTNTENSNSPSPSNSTSAAEKAMKIAALTGQIAAQESKIANLEKQLKNAQDSYKYNMDNYNKNPRYGGEYYSRAMLYQKEAEKLDSQIVNERKYLQALNAQKDFYSYKSGSHNISKKQLAWTQDGGSELIYRAVDGAILTPLNMGDKVFTHQMSENLWNLAQVPNLNMAKNSIAPVSNLTISIDGIEMHGVNDPVEFTKQLTNNLSNNSQVKKIIQDNTIGLALGNNSFTSRKR